MEISETGEICVDSLEKIKITQNGTAINLKDNIKITEADRWTSSLAQELYNSEQDICTHDGTVIFRGIFENLEVAAQHEYVISIMIKIDLHILCQHVQIKEYKMDEIICQINKYPNGTKLRLYYKDGSILYGYLDTIYETDNELDDDDPSYLEYYACTFYIEKVFREGKLKFKQGHLIEISRFNAPFLILDADNNVVWDEKTKGDRKRIF